MRQLHPISTALIHQNPWWQYRRDEYEHPDGSPGEFFYIRTKGSVLVIPVLDDGRIVLLNQFRYLNQQESLEFVGGGVKEGMTLEDAARAELLEEAGYDAGMLVRLGDFNPMNGATDELCTVFRAAGLKEVGAKPEISEEFDPRAVTIDELIGLVASGEVWDGMTLAAFAIYRILADTL